MRSKPPQCTHTAGYDYDMRSTRKIALQFSGIQSLSITVISPDTANDEHIALAELASVINAPSEDVSYGIALRQFQHCEARLGVQDDLKASISGGSPHERHSGFAPGSSQQGSHESRYQPPLPRAHEGPR